MSDARLMPLVHQEFHPTFFSILYCLLPWLLFWIFFKLFLDFFYSYYSVHFIFRAVPFYAVDCVSPVLIFCKFGMQLCQEVASGTRNLCKYYAFGDNL